VELTINNGSGSSIRISVLELDWPGSNDALIYVLLDDAPIWYGEEFPPPARIDSWSGSTNVGDSAVLKLVFGTNAASSGYDLQLEFNNGCEAEFSN
jgi:hypothetical protein